MDKQLRILFVGAHPDDNDIRAGGLALKYSRAGHKVKFISMCDGSGGHQTMGPAEIAARRKGEAQDVANFAGIEYDVWDITDCELVNDLETRKRLTREIRKFNPDILFCCRANDYHVDHRNCAALVQDASYCLIVPHFCPDVPAMKEMPVIMNYYDKFQNPPFAPDVAISIDDIIDEKLELLSCHESQFFEWLPYTYGTLHTVPEGKEARLSWLHEPRAPKDLYGDEYDKVILSRFVGYTSEWRDAIQAAKYRDCLIKQYGEEKGKKVHFAEVFCLCEYGTQLTPETKKMFFPF